MTLYSESPEIGNQWREQYLDQLHHVIAGEQHKAADRRQVFFKPDTSSIDAYETSVADYRAQYEAMLGWPLVNHETPDIPRLRQSRVAEDELGTISRVWIEALPELELYGLLFSPPGQDPHPLVVAQHGGGGTPELCSGFFGSANYNDMTRRVLRRGVAVFAPQLPLWQDRFGPSPERDRLDCQLKQLGGSTAALDIFQVREAIRALIQQPRIDAGRIGMIGLSWGGFYTLATAAVEPVIKVAVASCFFNDRCRYPLPAAVSVNAANHFLDAEIASLVCPRPLYIEVGLKDELFEVHSARPSAEQVRDRYQTLGIASRFVYHEHGCGHEFDPQDPGIDFLMQHL